MQMSSFLINNKNASIIHRGVLILKLSELLLNL